MFDFVLNHLNSDFCFKRGQPPPPSNVVGAHPSMPRPPLFGPAVRHGRGTPLAPTGLRALSVGRCPPAGVGHPPSLSLSWPSPTAWRHPIDRPPPSRVRIKPPCPPSFFLLPHRCLQDRASSPPSPLGLPSTPTHRRSLELPDFGHRAATDPSSR
jgi:hypothetical protein